MKIWKRNAIVATVLVLICAGIYFNWNASQNEAVDYTDMLDAEKVMNQTQIALPDTLTHESEPPAAGDTFAQIRLSRQETRDNAVELLQEAMAYEEGADTTSAASLDHIVSDALAEAQIESLVIAKGYEDCVAYISDELISLAVSSPETGLTEEDVALIADIVTSQTAYTVADLRIIEVK